MRANCKARYPRFLLLVLIIRLVPIGSAEYERMFSLINRIKTDLRSRMRTDRINNIMTVNRLESGLDTPNPEELAE